MARARASPLSAEAGLLLAAHLLFAHPVVHLLGVTVEELQVHALLILLPAQLPQLQQGGSLLREDSQLGRRGASVSPEVFAGCKGCPMISDPSANLRPFSDV